ncbi:MAG: hypothetical protein ACP5FK_07300 [bacterium]
MMEVFKFKTFHQIWINKIRGRNALQIGTSKLSISCLENSILPTNSPAKVAGFHESLPHSTPRHEFTLIPTTHTKSDFTESEAFSTNPVNPVNPVHYLGGGRQLLSIKPNYPVDPVYYLGGGWQLRSSKPNYPVNPVHYLGGGWQLRSSNPNYPVNPVQILGRWRQLLSSKPNYPVNPVHFRGRGRDQFLGRREVLGTVFNSGKKFYRREDV